jgi:hypothetical protein
MTVKENFRKQIKQRTWCFQDLFYLGKIFLLFFFLKHLIYLNSIGPAPEVGREAYIYKAIYKQIPKFCLRPLCLNHARVRRSPGDFVKMWILID